MFIVIIIIIIVIIITIIIIIIIDVVVIIARRRPFTSLIRKTMSWLPAAILSNEFLSVKSYLCASHENMKISATRSTEFFFRQTGNVSAQNIAVFY